MKQVLVMKSVLKLALVAAFGLQLACSSSDSDPAATTISGTIVAAPVNGASVLLKDAAGNTLAGPLTTGTDGGYSTVISGAVPDTIIVESSGGSYADEATGTTTDAGMLMAYVDGSSMSAGGEVHATPASTIVYQMVMTHGMTLSAAQAAFESAFGFAADTATAPADATAPAAGATEEELLAGLRAAAFSQLTDDLGLTPAEQFDLLTALAADLADGTLDGMGTGGAVSITASVMLPIDILNRFSQALVTFHEGFMESTNDNTGLTSDQIGILPFAKVALTDSYKIEYISAMMPAQGKSAFTLRITDKDTGAAVPGLTVDLMLMMHMADRNHSTPDVDCVASGTTAGDYECTVYYLMSTVDMVFGNSQGYWEIKAMTNMESARFYPFVGMAMGGTARVTLKGIDPDLIGGMLGPMSRNYQLFKDSLTGMTNDHTFEIFIAAMESMMSFPALEVGAVPPLNDSTPYELVVSSVTVKVATDEAFTTEVTASPNGLGLWQATSLTGLTDGTQGKIYVKLYVNGEQKTTNGQDTDVVEDVDGKPVLDGNGDTIPNRYTSFTVTPGM